MSNNQLPPAFIEKMQALLKENFTEFMQGYESENYHGLRVNTAKISLEDFEKISPFSLEPVLWCHSGFYYPNGERPGKHPYHEAGLYYLQEPSAMAVAEVLDPKPGDILLDLCAAPGGKSTHIAAYMHGEGLLISNEIHPKRARILAQNIERCGIKNAVVTNESPAKLSAKFPAFFDKIIVDAPCSGEGMFRKMPEAKDEWSPEQVLVCAERQLSILEEAHKMLKADGTIVYSTCTFSPEENEGVIAAFISRHSDYEIVSSHLCDLFSEGHSEWTAQKTDALKNTSRLWPHRLHGEGHFVAKLKRNAQSEITAKLPVSKTADPKKLTDYETFMVQTLRKRSEGNLILFGDELYAVPMTCPSLDGIKVVRPGLHLGTLKKNRFEPSHALALSLKKEEVFHTVDFHADSPEIYAYWQGESLPMEGEKGWYLITVDGYSFAFGKLSNGILKNHYPKGLRLLGK